MYVSVQRAARRLGVSPVTIRRWTSTGFLPCTRTPGGHRRIATEDIDELARSVGDGNHLAARLARERELDTMVSTAIALGSRHQLPALLAGDRPPGHQRTGLPHVRHLRARQARRRPAAAGRLRRHRPPPAGRRPVSAQALSRTRAACWTSACRPSSTSTIRPPIPPRSSSCSSDGGRTLLMVPLIYKDSTIGLIEVVDRERRRRFTRQELRLARAIAGHASVALVHARQLEDSRRESSRELARAAAALAARAAGCARRRGVRSPGGSGRGGAQRLRRRQLRRRGRRLPAPAPPAIQIVTGATTQHETPRQAERHHGRRRRLGVHAHAPARSAGRRRRAAGADGRCDGAVF